MLRVLMLRLMATRARLVLKIMLVLEMMLAMMLIMGKLTFTIRALMSLVEARLRPLISALSMRLKVVHSIVLIKQISLASVAKTMVLCKISLMVLLSSKMHLVMVVWLY